MFVNAVILLSIIAYMLNGKIGCFLFFFASILILGQKENMPYKLFHLCISSLPFSFIGILGMDMSHMVNWTTLYLVITIIYVSVRNYSRLGVDSKVLTIVLLLFMALVSTCALTIESAKSIIEIIQISIMVVTILFVWCNRINIAIDNKGASRLIDEMGNICVITAIATIVQWMVYRKTGREIGYITLTANGARVICNCLYKGMSVLSIFLGLGVIFIMLRYGIKSSKIVDTIKMGIILVGIVVNTSRTGLTGIAIVFAVYLVVGFLKKKKLKFLVMGTFGGAGIALAGYKLAATRGNLFDENGRIATWKAGIMIWKQSVRSILLGAGFEDSIWVNRGGMTSHNMMIQSLAQCGGIGTFLFIVLFIMYYKRIKSTPYVYVMLYLIITGMMITDFYANPFTTIAMCLIVIVSNTGFSKAKKI